MPSANILPTFNGESNLIPRRFALRWILTAVIVVSFIYYASTSSHVASWSSLGSTNVPSQPEPIPLPGDVAIHLNTSPLPHTTAPAHTTPPAHIPSSSELPTSPHWAGRANKVKAAFVHAYDGYMEHAFPHDELLPLENMSQDNFYGYGVSVVDSLDTMIIMGLDDHVDRAVEHVASLRFDEDKVIGFFEPVIRYLAGLISAYAMTNRTILLTRADELGRHMLPAFNTSSGIPAPNINLKTGEHFFNNKYMPSVCLAELGSCQLEFRALAHYTGRAEYAKAVDRVSEALHKLAPPDGLYPMDYMVEGVKPKDTRAAVGGCGDSTYEYFLKGYLLTNMTESRWLDMYLASAKGIIENLVYMTKDRQLMFVTDLSFGQPSGKLEHLSCFLPGLLALGAHRLPSLSAEERQRHLWAAEGLAHTCWLTYADSPTGLGPDEAVFPTWTSERWVDVLDQWKGNGSHGRPPATGQAEPEHDQSKQNYNVLHDGYLLRPETIESIYILWRVTGDAKWRERGWQIFEAIEKHTRTPSGYASLNSVIHLPASQMNAMPSYFLAETLKYLYLLCVDEEIIPLDRFVFNTEAHPLPIFDWSPWEKQAFNIL